MDRLSGLNILLLRSPRSDDPLVSSLIQAGAQVHSFPVLAIEPMVFNSADALLLDTFGDIDKVIFVSRHAVEYGVEWFRQVNIDLRKPEIFAVGPTTAAMLGDRGVSASYPAENPSSEGLLAMAAMESIEGQSILIVRGEGGRELLNDSLSKRGANVRCKEVYRRVLDVRKAEAIKKVICRDVPLVAILHSGEITRAYAGLLNLMPERVWDLPCIVPGVRVADIARKEGFNKVLVANSALANDMEEAVRYWYTSAIN